MSVFDKEAIEAAAKAVGDNTGCDVPKGCPLCTDIAQDALAAAEASLRERGKLKPHFVEGLASTRWELIRIDDEVRG